MNFIIILVISITLGAWGFERLVLEIKRQDQYQNYTNEHGKSDTQESNR